MESAGHITRPTRCSRLARSTLPPCRETLWTISTALSLFSFGVLPETREEIDVESGSEHSTHAANTEKKHQTKPKARSRLGTACAQGTFWGTGGGRRSPETQIVSPSSCWWPSWKDPWQISHSPGTQVPKHSLWSAALSCWRNWRCLSAACARHFGRADFRTHHIAAGLGQRHFTTAHSLRRFVEVISRWATIFRIKLEIDHILGIDSEWAGALSRNKELIKGCFPPEQRTEFFVNDYSAPVMNRFASLSTTGGQTSFASWNP